MSALTYQYTCDNCGNQFNAPGVAELSYGMFVMRSDKSDYAVLLSAISDSAFSETMEMVQEYPDIIKLNDREKSKIVQKVFGLICDQAPDGGKLIIGIHPKCPSCGSRKMKSWKQIHPAQIWPLPSVEHKKWDTKSDSEKLAAIDSAIRKIIFNKEFSD
jgi:hypothetical protein